MGTAGTGRRTGLLVALGGQAPQEISAITFFLHLSQPVSHQVWEGLSLIHLYSPHSQKPPDFHQKDGNSFQTGPGCLRLSWPS